MFYRDLIDLLGYDSFLKARFYPYRYVRKMGVKKYEDSYIHEYLIRSEHTDKHYDVVIRNNGKTIIDFSCSCPQFARAKTCKHIAAILNYHYSEIEEFEIVDEYAVSKEILKKYILNQSKANNIKSQLKIDVEFVVESYSINLRLHIGNEKKYLISTMSKLNNFIDCYINHESYEFGKKLTYNPTIHYFNEEDTKIIEFLIELSEEQGINYRGDISIMDRDFNNFLKVLKNKKFQLIPYGEITSIKEGLPTKFKLNKKEDNYVLKVEDYNNYLFIDSRCKYLIYDHCIYLLSYSEREYFKLLKESRIEELTFKKENITDFSEGLLPKIKEKIEIDENVSEITLPNILDVKIYFDILYSRLECNIVFCYKNGEINYFDNSEFLRDIEFEKDVVNELLTLGFTQVNQKLIMDDDEKIFEFLDENINKLKEKYKVFTSKKIDSTKIVKKININNNFSIGQSGIMTYNFDAEGIDYDELNKVFRALKQKKKYFKLRNNSILSLNDNKNLEDLNDMLENLSLSKNDIENGSATIPKYRALYIDSLKNNTNNNIKTNGIFDTFIDNFKKYKNIDIKLDDKENKILRDYQKDGIKWLYTLYKCDFGGILADEMGLGKSIQTIMFIKQILNTKKNAKIIIVVPTSLIYNWQKEFEKFAPELNYVTVADNKLKRKEVFDNFDKYNIFITSYGLIRNDKDEYENVDFELCVVDEAQNIKNYQAEMTKEIKKIKAKCKIALTGTPLENNITELWSIFDFIMPGYLNNINKFKERYNIKDVTKEDLEILKDLNLSIKPFILRRKKEDVVKSLPEKIENKVYIDLPNKQKMLYLKVLNDTKKEMDEMIESEGFMKSKVKILQLLTKLRQICIDPTVMYENYSGERAKIEELLKIVQENIANGHKILIFSSFKRVLENVKEIFKNNNISYYMIDGSVKSKDRMNMVETFNNDDTNCFLITLKAGGTGLNLTGADIVIHLDIWWNPQVENQATDRAHRIGQTKKVSVIKLITNGTIEERIIELQEKKKVLSDNILDGKDNSANLSSLSEQELKHILSIGE